MVTNSDGSTLQSKEAEFLGLLTTVITVMPWCMLCQVASFLYKLCYVFVEHYAMRI